MPFFPPSNNTQDGNAKNLYALAGATSNASNWSTFPAVSLVNINDNLLTNVGGTITIKNTDNANTNSIQTTSDQLLFNGSVVQTGPNVTSLRGLQGVVNLTTTNGNLAINDVGNDIQLTVLAGGIGVESLETLVGNIGLTSTGSTVAITTVGQNINLEATPNVGVTSVATLSGAVGMTSTGGTVGITTVGNNINLETLGITPITNWSQYPAIQDVNMVNHSLTSASSTGIVVDSPLNPITPTLNLTASNGIGGKVNIIANNGIGGSSFGVIDITANGGTTAGLTTGGSINITATTPVGTVGVSGKVTINGAGINSYAGALPVLASLTGYNYIHGDSAVNITAGAPPIVPSDPLCVYLYGTNGTLMYGTQYMGKIRPYSDLTINPTDLRIEKYSNFITTGYIVIDGCKTLNMEPTATLSVSNGTGTDGQVLGKSSGNLTWVTPSGSGVSSLNTLTGGLSLTSTNGSITITPAGTNIDLSVPPIPPVIGATGTTALTTANKNTTYIYTSGTLQNFTTAGLVVGDAGLVWYVKQASAGGDITIRHNGTAISGITSILHEKRVDSNTPTQIIYWSGTDLFMY